jgi:hypothetical protein
VSTQYQKGLLALLESRYESAAEHFHSAGASNEDMRITVAEAYAEYRQAHFSVAISLLRKILANRPSDPIIEKAFRDVTSASGSQKDLTDKDKLSTTRLVMEFFSKNEVDQILPLINEQARRNLDWERLQQLRDNVSKAIGGFAPGESEERVIVVREYPAYMSFSRSEMGTAELKLYFGEDGSITHLWLRAISNIPAEQFENLAVETVHQLAIGNMSKVFDSFNSQMRAVEPPSKLRVDWFKLSSAYGMLRDVKSVNKDPDQDVVVVLCAFQAGNVNVEVAFDVNGKIAGLYLLPAPKRRFKPPNDPQYPE